MLCGDRSDSAIADWGRCEGQKLAQALGFTQAKPPCAATLPHVLRQRDGPLVEAAWGAWAARGLAALPPAAGALDASALDGKTLRGSRNQGAPAVPLGAALSHRLGRTMGQQAGADQTKELPGMAESWRGLVLEGRVITVEALRTQRRIAPPVVAGMT